MFYFVFFCVVFLDELSPSTKYGKIENNTELIVTPYKDGVSNGIETTIPEPKPQTNGNVDTPEKRGTLYDRLFSKNAKAEAAMKKSPTRQISADTSVIDSTTLDNVTVKSSSSDEDSSDSDASNYDGNAQSFSSTAKSKVPSKKSTNCKSRKSPSPPRKTKPVRLDVQSRLFDALFAELKKHDRKSYRFRAVPRKWADSQMSELFLTSHNQPNAFDMDQVYVLNCETINENDERTTKEYYVSVRPCEENETIPKNIFRSIEINDVLMAHLKMQKYTRITLSTKKTVLNFVEKIELIPSSSCTLGLRDIEDTFKRVLIRSSRTLPMLINQEQVFRLDDEGSAVMVKIYPESFRYCLCDGEILRENKIFVVEQRRDLSGFFINAEEIASKDLKEDNADVGGSFSANDCCIQLQEFDEIVDKCMENIVVNSCLDERNQLRKVNNHLIIGNF